MAKDTIGILGAGIAGITAAYYAAKKGFDVTVFEQENYPAMRCSYANGGQVSVSNSEVWTTWANVYKGIKWMFKKDAPLLIRPSLDIDKAIWIAKFLYHTAKNEYARNTAKTIRMGLEARKLYQTIMSEHDLRFDQSNSGILHIYKNTKYFYAAKAASELYISEGCEYKLLNENEVINLEPTLKNYNGLVGGVWTVDDWTGDIHKFCTELSKLLADQYNVKFVYNYNVKHINELRQYKKIIIANGVGATKFAKTVGDKLNVYPVKGYSVTIPIKDTSSYESAPKTSLLDDEAKIVTSLLGNRLRVAGTAEFDGENYDIRRDRIKPLLNWVQKNFPNVDYNEYSSWACLRPMTPNMMPVYTRSKHKENVYYHVGHGHLGWTLAPYTAKLLIEDICHN